MLVFHRLKIWSDHEGHQWIISLILCGQRSWSHSTAYTQISLPRVSNTEGTHMPQVHQIWKLSKSTDVQQYNSSPYSEAHLADESWRAIQGWHQWVHQHGQVGQQRAESYRNSETQLHKQILHMLLMQTTLQAVQAWTHQNSQSSYRMPRPCIIMLQGSWTGKKYGRKVLSGWRKEEEERRGTGMT